jgi:hypothetical protein
MGDDLADLHLGAFGDEDFEGAGGFGKDFGSDLIGLDLEEGIAGGDGVAVLLLPAADDAGGDGFADGGDFDGDEIGGGGAHFFFHLAAALFFKRAGLPLAREVLAAAERGPTEGWSLISRS